MYLWGSSSKRDTRFETLFQVSILNSSPHDIGFRNTCPGWCAYHIPSTTLSSQPLALNFLSWVSFLFSFLSFFYNIDWVTSTYRPVSRTTNLDQHVLVFPDFDRIFSQRPRTDCISPTGTTTLFPLFVFSCFFFFR